ncbi:MAG: MobQ family relaxase [Pseudolabrys sp.]|nr:MobQ family relaxase [Pseudolabrys sp.]
MAIFHLAVKVIGRGRGRNGRDQSAVASAAYRSGKPLKEHATGAIKDYPRRAPRVIWSAIFAPADAPAWASDREALWNRVEEKENRKNSAFCRELEFSLPAELTGDQRVWLVTDFIRENFTRKGLIADIAIHAPDGHSDRRNFHCHAMVVERPIVGGNFAKHKNRDLQKRETLHQWRANWASMANRALARHGHAARIDHRTLKVQGVLREPTTHAGHVATEIERRGGVSYRKGEVQAVKARNALRLMRAAKVSRVVGAVLKTAPAPKSSPSVEAARLPEPTKVDQTDLWGVGIRSRP